MRKWFRKMWQRFLVVSFGIAIIGTIYWACCLDDESWIPTRMLGVNLAWVLLITISNDPQRIENQKRREKRNETANKVDRIKEFQRHSA